MIASNRRNFLQVSAAALAGALDSGVSKALAIPANNRTGTLKDVEHIVVLMQENRPFDHHFGTMKGVRGYSDPRAVQINLPLQNSTATTKASVFLQPAGAANVSAGFSVPANFGTLGGPANGVPVIPPFRVDPTKLTPPAAALGNVYMGGTNHGWDHIHRAWNYGLYDGWATLNGPMAMTYFVRQDIPYHFALADSFTVLDNYFCSIMGPTNPNRCYLWSGCIGNVDYVGAAGSDGHGSGPITGNGLSPKGNYLAWETLPEELDKAGVTWRIYQDLSGATFAPDFGDGGAANSFDGNYTDNALLYFAQYSASTPGSSLYDNAATGTSLVNASPATTAPASAWQAWAEGLFAKFKADVQGGKLPQVSWLIAPAGYTEHASYPCNYGAWYIAETLNILASNPEVFSKTVFIINYDEADGSFDHVVPPTPPRNYPAAPEDGGSTVDYHNEIVTTSTPNGPIGLGQRVPALVISPWSKGGYVNSQVFDHTSIIQFIEKRFGVHCRNLSPWRRAVCGDLTTVFNFKDPNHAPAALPGTAGYLPPVGELSGAVNPPNITVNAGNVIIGVPTQEKGVRPARALPYELDVTGVADANASTVVLDFHNTGKAGAVFQVRPGDASAVRSYTVGASQSLSGTWSTTAGAYDLDVYGPNGFLRAFKGKIGGASISVKVAYRTGDDADDCAIRLKFRNHSEHRAEVVVLDAYTGRRMERVIGERSEEHEEVEISLRELRGWYDLVIKVEGDAHFLRRLAGHVETGRDSISDPAMGGLVTLKA